MTKDKAKVIEKYKGIHLGYYDYKEGEYFVEDFLVDWIIVTAGEDDQGITHEGLDFIDEYYGNEYIIDKVLKKNSKFPFHLDEPYKFLSEHKERSYSAKN